MYHDAECTVSSDEDVERRWREAEASADRAQARQQEAPIGENAELDEVVHAGNDALRRIRRANDIIADEELSRQIDSIENSCRQILSVLEQRPQLLSQLRTFLRYYLPTTLKLLDSYALLEEQGIEGDNITASKQQISQIMDTLIKGFEKQLDQLFSTQAIDINSDIEVLENMMAADGLKESDFKLKSQGGH